MSTSKELTEAETESDEKTDFPDIFLLKLEIDDNNWVTVAVDINSKVKDVVAKVLKRPKIPKSTLCIVYNAASALDPECNLYELMKLDPLGDNIFIILIPDDGTDEHRQAIYELFPTQIAAYKPFRAPGPAMPNSKKTKKKKRITEQNRKTTKQFSTDLHKFVSANIGGLDAVIFDIKANEESAKTKFANRVSKYRSRSDMRRGTITKLKKELNEHNSTQPNYNYSNVILEHENEEKYENDEKDVSWIQHLNSVRQQLCNEMWSWNLIESNIKWPTNVSDECEDKHIYERTLINQMQAWMRRYGMAAMGTAMSATEDIHELKKQLLKINEEADELDEELVQVTQQLFNMENEKNLLKKQLNKQQYAPTSPRFNVPNYNKPLPQLTHSKSQTLPQLTDELCIINDDDQITELQIKMDALKQSNISLKKEVIEFKVYQKQVRKK